MSNLASNIHEVLTNKPDCIIDFSNQGITSDKIRELGKMPGLAILEIAGRDSIAAAIKHIEDGNPITGLIPTFAYTGTEFGDCREIERALHILSRRLPGIMIHDLILIGSPRFWNAMNGRYISELTRRFGFYTPCIGCHLYLHSIRVPLAIKLGNIPIIAGERESHDGRLKINQTSQAISYYHDLVKDFDIDLVLPIREIEKGQLIRNILGCEWQEDQNQLDCVLSGNYRQSDGGIRITQDQVESFMTMFALPLARKVIRSYIEGHGPDHVSMAGDVLA